MWKQNRITSGEITRNLQKVFTGLDDLTKAMEARPDWEDLRRAEKALEVQILAEEKMRKAERITADKALRSLEDWNKWAVRSVGALVLAAVATVTLSGGVPGV